MLAEPDFRMRARRRFQRTLLALWLCGTAALVWVMLIFPNRPAGGPNRDVALEVPEHPTLDQLEAALVKAKVLTHPRAFAFYMRLLHAEPKLRSRWVVVNRSLGLRDHLPRLIEDYGVRAEVNVLVPEGFTRFDVATRLERFGIASREQLLQAMTSPDVLKAFGIPGDSVEGYLFPAVYRLPQGSNPKSAVARMIGAFAQRTEALFDAYAREHDGAPFSLTPHELVTLASIVEREAHLPEERPIIAGVFINRLTEPTFKPHRLQADPTVAYGCLVARDLVPTCKDFDGRRITPQMVRDPLNPYNTYRREGLPPGPICNPGMSAIEAALHPANHAYFYFVAKGGGRHAFSHSLEEHNANIRGAP